MEEQQNSLSRGVNRPLFVASVVMAGTIICGLGANFLSISTGVSKNDSRITNLEEYVTEHKRVSVTRDELNRLDLQLQQKAGREELLAIQRRIDDIRTDLAEIKQALQRR